MRFQNKGFVLLPKISELIYVIFGCSPKQDQLDVLRNQTAQERRMRANVALKISENIAQERESLVKELDMLRSLNTKVSLN